MNYRTITLHSSNKDYEATVAYTEEQPDHSTGYAGSIHIYSVMVGDHNLMRFSKNVVHLIKQVFNNW